MGGRGGFTRSIVAGLLICLWLLPAWAQEQPPELEAIYKRGLQLYQAGKYAEAVPIAEEYIRVAAAQFGEQHSLYGTGLGYLGVLYQQLNRASEADPLLKRSLAIKEKALGSGHTEVAVALYNLGWLMLVTNRLAEAEPLMRRALAIDEKSYGPDHPLVAARLNNLARLLLETDRLAEAEPLMRRALVIAEKSFGPDHSTVNSYLNNLALLLKDTNRFTEAEPLMRRALANNEKSLGPEHPNVANSLNSLSSLLQDTNRLTEAEPLMRRALDIAERSFGAEHSHVATGLNNLAQLLSKDANRLAEAEPLMRRALAINEKSLGPEHPQVGLNLNNLAVLSAKRGDWAAAAALGRRAKPILIGRGDADAGRDGLGKALPASNTLAFRAHARSIHRAGAESDASREEGFELAQWALRSSAAQALSQMSARSAKGPGPLAQLVRERQDLVGRRAAEDKQLLAAVGRGDGLASEVLRKSVASLDLGLDAIDVQLSSEFKEYAELANPKPLTIAATQALLNDGEALVLFLDVPRFGNLPGETLIWVVTKTDARWARIELASLALVERAAALRCGLDRGQWEGEGKQRCLNHLTMDGAKAPDGNSPLPFDLTRSHQLYQALFGPVADLIKGKHLLIVPSGALTQIPFQVLVTDPVTTGVEALRRAAWARQEQRNHRPALCLVAESSARARQDQPGQEAVRGLWQSSTRRRRLRSGWRAEMARAKQQCSNVPRLRSPDRVAVGMRMPLQQGGLADLASIRAQVPLPETADELCAVAHDFGVPDSEIWLGARATELEVKRLSDSGELAGYRIVHFATHGAMAGELKAGAEPGLILTPPKEATADDDGYLSASEVAGLKLDADWVILSACNTAAGGSEGAEALSGMSRAFFYAGARALLVSHWAVASDPTVKLITKTLGTMAADKSIGRSEALRQSMVALIEQGEPHEAHPSYWAPFVVVGEGSSTVVASSPITTSAIPAPAAPAEAPAAPTIAKPAEKKTTKARPKASEPWNVQIWSRPGG